MIYAITPPEAAWCDARGLDRLVNDFGKSSVLARCMAMYRAQYEGRIPCLASGSAFAEFFVIVLYLLFPLGDKFQKPVRILLVAPLQIGDDSLDLLLAVGAM